MMIRADRSSNARLRIIAAAALCVGLPGVIAAGTPTDTEPQNPVAALMQRAEASALANTARTLLSSVERGALNTR